MLDKGRSERRRGRVERTEGLLIDNDILANLKKVLNVLKLLRLSRVKHSVHLQVPNVTMWTVLERLWDFPQGIYIERERLQQELQRNVPPSFANHRDGILGMRIVHTSRPKLGAVPPF